MGILSYVSKKAESPILKEGVHVVRAVAYKDLNSFQEVEMSNGQFIITGLKKSLPKWTNPGEQTVVMFSNQSGVFTDRFQHDSWKKPSDLTQAETESGEFTESGGYVVTMVNGKLERVHNPAGIETCDKIIRNFLFAIAGGIEGVNELDQAIADKREFIIVITKKPWLNPATGTTEMQYRLSGCRPLGKLSSESKAEESDIPEDLQS